MNFGGRESSLLGKMEQSLSILSGKQKYNAQNPFVRCRLHPTSELLNLGSLSDFTHFHLAIWLSYIIYVRFNAIAIST